MSASPFALCLAAPAQAATIAQSQTVQASSLGSGSVAFQGGTLVVDKSATYSNDFTLVAPAATTTSSSSTATATNTIDAHGNAGTFSSVFSDATSGAGGVLTILDSVGGGQVVLGGANTYTGPTSINAGATLALSSTGAISLSKSVQDNGTFDISATSQGTIIASLGGSGTVVLGAQALHISNAADTFSGTITGSGSLTISGGTEIIDGSSSNYTGGTTIAALSILELGNADANGAIPGAIADAGTLEFNRTDAITFAQTISGTGSVTLAGGTVTFTTAEPYSGLTTVTAGTLALSGSGSIAASSAVDVEGTFDISATSGASVKSLSGAGSIVLGAAPLAISNAIGTFSGVISGTGGLVVSGGAQVLTGANTYSGGTTVTGGSLQIGNGTTTGSIIGNIADGGAVIFDYSTPQEFDAVISGNGQVKLIGGTLTLTSAQGYTGVTTINGGKLILTGAGSIASSQNIVDNGTLDLSATNNPMLQSLSGTGGVTLGSQTLTITDGAATFSGVIQGSGGLTVTGGTQTLAGANLYTGPTVIAGGTLAISNINALAVTAVTDNGVLDVSAASNTLGSSTIVNISTLTGNGSVVLGNRTLNLTAPGTFAGSITGVGNLTIPSGTETLTGASSYSGTTTVASSATLALAGNGSLSSSTTVAVAGTFDISAAAIDATVGSLSGAGSVILGNRNLILASGNSDYGGAITGTGGLVVSGGTQILSGTNSYSGGTSITDGMLQLGNGGSGGSIVGDVSNAGTLAFNYSGTTVFGGAISGTGTVTQSGPGTLILTGANSYSGGTTIDSGALQIGNDGTSGTVVGDVVDNASLVFARSDAIVFNGAISGIGGVSQIGGGTLTLSGANSYTGRTMIAAGSSLALGSANAVATSSQAVDNGVFDVSGVAAPQITSLAGNGVVALGVQTLSITKAADNFAGVIAGAGGLTVTGGNQTLSGVSSYTGATAVTGGTLAVTGSIASSSGVTVGAGATLSGTGTVSQVTVGSGASLAPGLAAAGSLKASAVTFASGSNLLIDVTSTSAPALAVSGSANLGGTVSVASVDGTIPLGQTLTIVTAADGVSGSFSGATVLDKGAQYSSSISSDANDVYLTIDLAKLSPLLPGGVSPNQANAIAGIDAAIAQGRALPAGFNPLANLSSAALASGATQLAGEIGGDVSEAENAIYTPYQDAVFDHLGDLRGRAIKPALLVTRPDVWAAVIGGSQIVAGDAALGSQKLDSHSLGFVAGMDWPVSSRLLVGGALSIGSVHFRVNDDLGTGKANSYGAGLYGLMQFTPRIYGAGLLSLGEDAVSSSRSVTVATPQALGANFNDQFFGGRYETGIDLNWIAPYLAIADRLARMPSYAETASAGSGDFALSYASQNSNTAGVELGLRNTFDQVLGRNWSMHFSDRLAWQHDVFNSYGALASYRALPGSQFQSFGSQPGKDFALFSFDAEARNRFGMILGAGLEANVSRQSQSYYGIGHFGFTW